MPPFRATKGFGNRIILPAYVLFWIGYMYLPVNAHNETSALDSVILGIGIDPAEPASYNPKAEFHLEQGSYPTRDELITDIHSLEKVLTGYGVKVFRPLNLKQCTQLFTRDLGFVIGDEFFISTMNKGRENEKKGISYLLELMNPAKVIDLSKQGDMNVEGGDIVLFDNTIFVGLSERTDKRAFEYLEKRFSGIKNVVQVKIVTDKNDHREHSLHLDCVFQPVGNAHAIIYEENIKNCPDLYEHLQLPETNIFKANQWQFMHLATNVLSLDEQTVIIEREFTELGTWLSDRGFKVVEVDFKNICKLGGLFRCATLPLFRRNKI